jgi:hypothetical protein
MQVVNATPPADFPEQVIIMDREFAKRHADKGFYLRVVVGPHETDTIELNGEMTLPGAVKSAIMQGYAPTHWMEVGSGYPSMLPSGIRTDYEPKSASVPKP